MTGARDALEADALRAFAVFARHLNLTSAAAELHLSQPSLHVKLRKLATALGVELYERRGRGLALTAAGDRLATFARDTGRRVDDFVAGLDAEGAPVAVAAGRGAFRWVIGTGLARLARSGRALRVVTADREQALRDVTTGEVDLAVIAYDPPPPTLESRLLATFPQVVLVPEGHALAARDRVTLADLAGVPLVVPPPDRPHRRSLDRSLAAVGAALTVAAEVEGWDLMAWFAGQGLGGAIVNGCVQPAEGVRAVPVGDLPAVGYWAAWRRERAALAEGVTGELTGAAGA